MVENVLFVISLPEKKKKRTDSAVEMMDQLDYFHPAMLPPPSMYDHGKPLLLCIVTVHRFVYVTNKNIVTVRPSKVNVCTLPGCMLGIEHGLCTSSRVTKFCGQQ